MLSGKENMIKTVKDAKNTDWKKSNSQILLEKNSTSLRGGEVLV